MAYDYSTTSSITTPVKGDEPKDQFREYLYILPNGNVWEGPVHKMENNNWMTGEYHSSISLPVYQYPLTINYPRNNSVAISKPLNTIFSYTGVRTVAIEENLLKLTTLITSVKQLLNNEKIIIDILSDKLASFLSKKVVQEETNGAGTIVDRFEYPLSLKEESPINVTDKIESISYFPKNDRASYIFFGNIVTLGTSEGWGSLSSGSIAVDIISRRNFTIAEIVDKLVAQNYPDSIEEFREIPSDIQKGLQGVLKINLTVPTEMNKIRMNLPTDVKISNIRYNTSTGSDAYDELQGTNFLGNKHTRTIAVSTIYMDIEYIEPVPFTSYAYYDANTEKISDFIGLPDTNSNLEFSGDDSIYERSRLLLDPIFLLSETYQLETEHRLGPYFCQGGGLKSIYIFTDDVIPEDFNISVTYINYFIIINGVEYPITPQNRIGDHPSKYVINSTLGSDAQGELAQTSTYAFIETDETISWELKVIISRPSSYTNMTPLLEAINFMYTTVGYNNAVESNV